jgi:hypothetical protein
MLQRFRIFVYQKTTHKDSVMTQFIIQSRDRKGTWYDEPDGRFDTLADADRALDSLIEVCGYDPDTMRIVEITD